MMPLCLHLQSMELLFCHQLMFVDLCNQLYDQLIFVTIYDQLTFAVISSKGKDMAQAAIYPASKKTSARLVCMVNLLPLRLLYIKYINIYYVNVWLSDVLCLQRL